MRMTERLRELPKSSQPTLPWTEPLSPGVTVARPFAALVGARIICEVCGLPVADVLRSTLSGYSHVKGRAPMHLVVNACCPTCGYQTIYFERHTSRGRMPSSCASLAKPLAAVREILNESAMQ